jgi:hypothetical protein
LLAREKLENRRKKIDIKVEVLVKDSRGIIKAFFSFVKLLFTS